MVQKALDASSRIISVIMHTHVRGMWSASGSVLLGHSMAMYAKCMSLLVSNYLQEIVGSAGVLLLACSRCCLSGRAELTMG